MLAAVLPATPCIVVLDELPWLAEQDALFDGALQTAWDRLLSGRPVLMLLLGSDIHMMARLTAYDRPFFGRADNLVLGPLTVAETATATGLGPADAIDALLVSGGLPGILRNWPHGTPALSFLEAECADPAAPLFSVPESALMAEFPAADQARRVLEAVVVQRRWAAWRGRAVEPLVRQALELATAAGELPWPDLDTVGGWWNRQFNPEIDLVGTDRPPVAQRILFAGSIKWLATPFDGHDLADLVRGAAQVPGFAPDTTGLAVVSLSGTTPGLDPDLVNLVWGPGDIVSAWRS